MIDFSTFPVRDWNWGGATLSLYLYCNKTWTDADGVTHLKSEVGSLDPYQICPGTVVGRAAAVSSFEVAPTVNALDGSDVRVTGVLVDADGIERTTLFKSKRFPLTPDPLTYPDFLTFNKACEKRLGPRYGTIEDFMALLATFVGSVLAASRVILGAVYLNIDPADPAHPEAVGSNSPGLAVAAGIATLANGRVTVACADVLAASGFQLTMQGQSAGFPHPETVVEGVSFDIVSSDPGDNGNVMWAVFNNL